MLGHERAAFLKFFSIYFGSVALLILSAGYFYYEEQKKSLIEKEHFSIIEYTRQLKMNMKPQSSHISHKQIEIEIKNFNMDNFTIKENRFEKYLPYSWEGGFLLVTKDKSEYEKALFDVKIEIIFTQIALLSLFATLSFFLAKKALLPMRNAITKLDNFSKDLIHDLNTPLTSILLNITILQKETRLSQNRALERIVQSASDIAELHKNLSQLLHEEGMVIAKEPIFEPIWELLPHFKSIYADIRFYVEHAYFEAPINREAFKQVMSNLISNAAKYNKKNGYVKIYKKENSLCIEDGGIGIQNPSQIFERSYKEHSRGNGIGLDIVKRLCDAMKIEIEVSSTLGEHTCITLHFDA